MIIFATYSSFQCRTKTNILSAWKQVHFIKFLKELSFSRGWSESITSSIARWNGNSIKQRKKQKLTAQLHKLFRMLLVKMNLLGEFLIQTYGAIGSTVYIWGLWKKEEKKTSILVLGSYQIIWNKFFFFSKSWKHK